MRLAPVHSRTVEAERDAGARPTSHDRYDLKHLRRAIEYDPYPLPPRGSSRRARRSAVAPTVNRRELTKQRPSESRISTLLSHSAPAAGTALPVKGFGCRPVVTYPRVLRAGVRKPPGKEPAVGGAGGGGRWRFDGAAARASDALSDGVGGGSTIATVGALRRRSPTTCGTATASWSATGTSRHTHSALG